MMPGGRGMMPCSECGDYASDTELLQLGRHAFVVRCRTCGYYARQEGSKAWAVRSWNREQRRDWQNFQEMSPP